MGMVKPTRIHAAGDILMICFLLVFPHLGFLPIYIYPVVVFFILWLYLRLRKQTYADIGFRMSDFQGRAVLIGGVAGMAYFFLNFFLLGPWMIAIFHLPKADVSDFNYVRDSLSGYLLILLIAWVLAVPYEEIIFRGFIFSRIWVMAGERWGFAISTFVSSILFAIYHVQQGWAGVIHALLFSFVAMILYKVFKGNLWYLIFFHILYDTFAITAIRMGYM